MKTRIVVTAGVAALAAGIGVGISGQKSSPPAHRSTVLILRAVDGDTIVPAKGPHVRLLGVDTPEDRKPGVPVQCYSLEAAAFTQREVAGRTVHLTTEPSSGDVTDKYGRTLAYVTFAHHDLGAMLLRGGFARVYAFRNRHFAKRARYERVQAKAQAAHVGRWGKC